MASDNTNSSDEEVLHTFLFFNVLRNGKVNIFLPPDEQIPPADDPVTGVKIKDVQISSDVSARLFLPPSATTAEGAAATKLPVFLYVHGGGFCMRSAFAASYTNLLTRLAAAGNLIAVSVEYGLFPSRPLPACYHDSWAALRWVAAHYGGAGDDPWLNHHGDFNRLYIGGNSAGGNISHYLAVRAGSDGLPGEVKVAGMILVHPYFAEDDKMWMYMCPSNEGPRDRRMCPDPEDLKRVGCGRVLVVLAERDSLRDAGMGYVVELLKSGWNGTVEIMENKEKGHSFHIRNPQDEEAGAIQRRTISFINHTTVDHN